MTPKDQSDHISILALMMVGVLAKRMDELGHLDGSTAARLHQLVKTVRLHAGSEGLYDLDLLFDNIDKKLGDHSG